MRIPPTLRAFEFESESEIEDFCHNMVDHGFLFEVQDLDVFVVIKPGSLSVFDRFDPLVMHLDEIESKVMRDRVKVALSLDPITIPLTQERIEMTEEKKRHANASVALADRWSGLIK